MEQEAFPTKGNLIAARHTLVFSRQGHALLDQKLLVLSREIEARQAQLTALRAQTQAAFQEAQTALARAHTKMGRTAAAQAALCVPEAHNIHLHARSIAGVAIALARYENIPILPHYSLHNTSPALDDAVLCFHKASKLLAALATAENTVSRLEANIRKVQKRANALKYVVIPKYEARIRYITAQLEERERDGFVRLKLAKGANATAATSGSADTTVPAL